MSPFRIIVVCVIVSSVACFMTSKPFYSFKLNSDAPSEGISDVDAGLDLDKLSAESALEAAKPKFETVDAPAIPRKAPRQAQWFPLLLAPSYLDGSMAGDVGFDPLNLAGEPGRLQYLREAEVKHARLAMLASAGWPLSELWHKEIATALGLDSILAEADKAPSVLNGGLVNEWIIGVAVFTLATGALLELKGLDISKRDGHKPGDFGFDPLGLYPFRAAFGIDKIAEKVTREEKLARAKFDMEAAEIKNGRLAMLAITGMCLQEFISGIPVVQQTPFFFGDPIL